MKHIIPAKTFLMGEYIALAGGPAIVLTTTPTFELLDSFSEQTPFHKDSPAGKFCREMNISHLSWKDPYAGLGGLGASSAQFVGAYWAYCSQQNILFSADKMLETYFQFAWSGKGECPSGYDVLAQIEEQCVLIQQHCSFSCAWPFSDLGFILLHTNQKLATHEHLNQDFINIKNDRILIDTALNAFESFKTQDSYLLIQTIQNYYKRLLQLNLVAAHTQAYIEQLQKTVEPLAIKGCGALGADIIFLLFPKSKLDQSCQILIKQGGRVIATSGNLYSKVS